jgi:hypothetical protein
MTALFQTPKLHRFIVASESALAIMTRCKEIRCARAKSGDIDKFSSKAEIGRAAAWNVHQDARRVQSAQELNAVYPNRRTIMYTASDPRAALNKAAPKTATPAAYKGSEYARFYEVEPTETTSKLRTWYSRGQNLIVAYTKAEAGAVLTRDAQIDEYVVLLPQPNVTVVIEAGGAKQTVGGYSIVMVPPGKSTITVTGGGEVVRLFTTRSSDLAAKCSNAASYDREPDPNVPPFQAWPEPKGGYRIRAYSLDVPKQDGRFGRIFRCSTIMVNYLEGQTGPRDIGKLSPHHHDDFEQYSLALSGSYMHHMRWPWTPDFRIWREDEHALCGSPSVAVIPPPAIHTSRGMDAGFNQLVDVFCPPRRDFSEKAGWVLNADDYPMP